ncbi:MAG: hypothetical protein AAGI34_16575 [Pseudomonadota bacterium]
MTAAVRVAERNTAAVLERREGAARVRAEALAWLVGHPEGRRYLSLQAPRALARGAPAARCPAVSVSRAPTTGGAVSQALAQCLARVATLPDCGCEVLAYDDILAVPRTEMAYATGTTARLSAPALGLDGLFVAEALGLERVLLRGLGGRLGEAVFDGEGGVQVVLDGASGAPAARFEGRDTLIGWRRGRLARRITARDGEGRTLVLLIGFSPEELAAGAGALLAPEAG